MFFNHYSKKEVREIVKKVSEEYDKQIAVQKDRINELIEKNRELSAKVSELESAKQNISDAMIESVQAGKKIEERSAKYVENQLRGLKILCDRCKKLSADMSEKYATDETEELISFFERVDEILDEDGAGFDYEQAMGPTKDLAQLCKELGIEDDGEEDKEFIFFDDDETDEKKIDN